ncbi:hypothetical protein ACA910_010439 [Epithemia clementina (nom. ined.)]
MILPRRNTQHQKFCFTPAVVCLLLLILSCNIATRTEALLFGVSVRRISSLPTSLISKLQEQQQHQLYDPLNNAAPLQGKISRIYALSLTSNEGSQNERREDNVALGIISADYRTESSSSNVLDMMKKYPNLLTKSNYNEQAFENYLKEHDIESLKDLQQKIAQEPLTFVYCERCGVDSEELEKLLKQTCEERLEDFLHQQVEIIGGGGEEELKSANERFSKEAVDVAGPTDNGNDQRKDDICLVMGPSGSGKTFYALKGLSRKKSSKGGSQDERYFTLYYKITKKENLEASDGSHTFSTSEIEKAMHASKVGKVRQKLDMRISLILDEAATAEEHIAELTNLSKIYIILSRYCTSPRLIVVGTGIDNFTSSMGTGTQVHKYRMRQWSLSNFEKALPNWLPDLHHRDDKREKLTKILENEPLYQRLLTNARAAYFLARAVETYLYADNVQQHMPTVITAVATKYIKSNGLCDLSSSSRRRVARAVFKLLDDTSRVVEQGQSHLKCPTFATDEGNLELEDDELAMATSLIDYNVEIKNRKVILVQGDHTVDVSPAITLVLFALVDVLGDVFSNWSGFKVLVAMVEIHHLVVKQTGKDFQVRLVKLKKPFLPTFWRKNLDVPILESDCVYLNGANAPFGDVLSTGRFAQAKHKTSTEQLVLDLQDELSKMGLVNGDNNNNKACAATTALMQEWQMGSNHSINKVAQDQTPKKEKMERDTIDQARAEVTLLQQKIIEFDTYKQFRCTDKNSKVTLSHDRTTYTSEDPLPAQVEAVFYTNASQFKIKGLKRTETMIISPSDLVNHSGDLKPEKDQWVKNNIKGLRDGVCIRFVFVSQAFR